MKHKIKIYLEKCTDGGWRWHKYEYNKAWFDGLCPHRHYMSVLYRTRAEARQAKRDESIAWIRV